MVGTAILGWLVLMLAAPETAPPQAPSVELLMYLGEFEDASGDFVDPMTIEGDSADGEQDAQPDANSAKEDDVPPK